MKRTKKRSNLKPVEYASSSYLDGIHWLVNQRPDMRLDAVIDEVNASIGRGDAHATMEALLAGVNWNACAGDTLRGVVLALFAVADDRGIDGLDEEDDDRRERLALAADKLHEKRCKCCAEHDELRRRSEHAAGDPHEHAAGVQ